MQCIVVSNEILLERIEVRDASTIFYAIDQNRTHLGRWLPFVDQTNTIRDSESYIRNVILNRDATLNEVYTIWYKGEFSGTIGFHNTDRVNEKTEIGYWLVANMTGKGIITRSCLQLVSIAFEMMRMNRICIKCANGNTASENVALRLGFGFEGIERNGERFHDHFLDLKVFSLLREESGLLAH